MTEALLSFEEIHEAYRPKIRRFLVRMVGESEAEDLTQEVFMKIHRALPRFKGDSQLSTWIYRIASNAALDKLRSPDFRRTAEHAPLPEESEPLTNELGAQAGPMAHAETLPERQVFLKQGLECYCGILHSLPVNYRAVVALSELGDLAVEEIANVLGLNPGTVKIRLHRGRERLLRELKAYCKPEDWL